MPRWRSACDTSSLLQQVQKHEPAQPCTSQGDDACNAARCDLPIVARGSGERPAAWLARAPLPRGKQVPTKVYRLNDRQKSAPFPPGGLAAMPSAAQQRWLLRIAAAAALVGGCAAATASLLSSESHFAALPLRFAAEAWLASGNLTSDLLSSAGGGGAGCGNAPPAAL